MTQPPFPAPGAYPPPPQQKPRKTLWIVLGVVAGSVVLCCGAGGALLGLGGSDNSSDDGGKDASGKHAHTKSDAEANDKAHGSDVGVGFKTQIYVDGKKYNAIDVDLVQCAKQGGEIVISSSSVTGKQALGAFLKDGNPPKVETLSVLVGDVTLQVTDSNGVRMGSSSVSVEGDHYTITGNAVGTDSKHAGLVSKSFKIEIAC